MSCPNCGNELKHTYEECPYCDHPVNMKDPETGLEKESEQGPMPKSQKTFLVVSIVLFFALSALLVITNLMG